MDLNRRTLFKGAAAGAAGTALTGGLLIGGARADAKAAHSADTSTATSYPFHGAHQSGILTPGPSDKQRFASFTAFDITAATRADLVTLMKVLTERARTLTRGGAAPDLGIGHPPADSAVLGGAIPADGLTVTVGVGSTPCSTTDSGWLTGRRCG